MYVFERKVGVLIGGSHMRVMGSAMRKYLVFVFGILCMAVILVGCSAKGSSSLSLSLELNGSPVVVDVSSNNESYTLKNGKESGRFSLNGLGFEVDGTVVSADVLDELMGEHYLDEGHSTFDVNGNSAFSYVDENGLAIHGIFINDTQYGVVLYGSDVDNVYMAEQILSFGNNDSH